MEYISFEKYTLSNGLQVILHQDNTLPMAALNIWYHVGSKDEEAGRTGFAHLFEHVMFEGSKHHNRDYFEPLQKVGADLNGSTTNDRTNYWETLPSNHLELALWLESDRMGFLLEALDEKRFDVQRNVVKNERRQSYENRPYGKADLEIQSAVFPPPHPYNWPTIGSQQDLDAASLQDVKDFFRRYYSSSNASLAIAGNIDINATKELVDKYFATLTPGPAVKRMERQDSNLKGQTAITLPDNVQFPRLYLTWPTVPLFDDDQPVLDVLSVLLADGRNSRLTQELMHQKQIVQDVRAFHHAQEISGEFHIIATAASENSLTEIEESIRAELSKLRREPPSDTEIIRAKTRIESLHVRQLEPLGGFGGRADQLNFYNVFGGDPSLINTDIERYRTVTPQDIQRVAIAALGEDHVKLTVQPKKSLHPMTKPVDRAIVPVGGKPASFKPPIPHRTTLTNGMNILFIQKHQVPITSFGVLIAGGGLNDPPDRPGLSHLSTSMLVEGTSSRSGETIAGDMEALGAHLSREVYRECSLMSSETLSDHWPKGLEIMADVVRNPTFPNTELERVRKERISAIQSVADSANSIAQRASRALLYGPDSPYGHPLGGNVSSMQQITRKELVESYNIVYDPSNMTLIAVGDMTMDELVAQAEDLFGAWTNPAKSRRFMGSSKTSKPPRSTIYLADKPGASQSIIRVGHLTIPRMNEGYYALAFLNYILGGDFTARLNMNLRQDKGYSYGYRSTISWSKMPSAWLAGGSVQTNVTKESVVETIKELTAIKTLTPVTKAEFQDARDGLLRGLPAEFETQHQIMGQLMQLAAFELPDDQFISDVEKLESLTIADVHSAAMEYILQDNFTVLVVGDRNSVEPGLLEIGLPLVNIDYDGRPL